MLTGCADARRLRNSRGRFFDRQHDVRVAPGNQVPGEFRRSPTDALSKVVGQIVSVAEDV